MDLTYKPFIRDSIISDITVDIPTSDITPYKPKYYNTNNNTKLPEEDSTLIKENNSQDDIKETNTVESPIIEIKEKSQEKPIYHGDKYDAFVKAYNSSGADPNKFNFFAKLASKESGFDPYIQNQLGAPAYGYFQFMQGTSNGRSWDNISRFANSDIETFRNSPKLQIQAAQKLADAFLKGFSKEDYKKARALGYSDSALLAGAWLGGVGGVRKFLHKGVSVDDKSWSKDKKTGTDIETRMREFNNMFKNGGLIKLQKGGITASKEWLKDWYRNRKSLIKQNIKQNQTIPFPVTESLAYNLMAKNIDLTSASINPSKLPDNADGLYTRNGRRIYLRTDSPSVAVHEWTHSSRPDAQIKEIDKVKDTLGDSIYDQKTITPNSYLDSSNEIYARLMQLRHALNIDPNHKFTNEEIESLKNRFTESKSLTTRLQDKNGNKDFTVTTFDKNNNILDVQPLNPDYKPVLEESRTNIKYDTENTYDILNRYSTNFIKTLLNDIAKDTNNKKRPLYVQDGTKLINK